MVSFQCSKSWAAAVEILSLKIRISIYFSMVKLFMCFLLSCLQQTWMATSRNRSPASLGAGNKGKLIPYFF